MRKLSKSAAKTALAVVFAISCSQDGGTGNTTDTAGGDPGIDAKEADTGFVVECGDGVCSFGEFCAICPADCDCEKLAATPPMGWNSWNRFHCDIDEDLVKEIADAMVDSGMKAAGYEYVNLDDCWQVDRDAGGEILADPVRFPSGIKALADYVHGKGLKFGLYTCAGTLTCQDRPGSFGYEFQDAATWASWGVDYVKVDWCHTEGMDARERYKTMHEAIAASGRPMVHSICNWGLDDPWTWGSDYGQLWRTTADIVDNFVMMTIILDMNSDLAGFAGPGHWNDPDMLEVGNGGMTDVEYRAHFSLWAMLAAPLITGNDLRDMSDATRDILLNEEVIAVDQDPAGIQGVRVREGQLEVWARPLALDGARAVVLFNRTTDAAKIGVTWQEIGLGSGPASVRDLWKKEDLGEFDEGFSAEVPSHGVVMLVVKGAEKGSKT